MYIHAPVRSPLILVCLSLLLIFGRLPHHCPFPELGLFTQTFSVKGCKGYKDGLQPESLADGN